MACKFVSALLLTTMTAQVAAAAEECTYITQAREEQHAIIVSERSKIKACYNQTAADKLFTVRVVDTIKVEAVPAHVRVDHGSGSSIITRVPYQAAYSYNEVRYEKKPRGFKSSLLTTEKLAELLSYGIDVEGDDEASQRLAFCANTVDYSILVGALLKRNYEFPLERAARCERRVAARLQKREPTVLTDDAAVARAYDYDARRAQKGMGPLFVPRLLELLEQEKRGDVAMNEIHMKAQTADEEFFAQPYGEQFRRVGAAGRLRMAYGLPNILPPLDAEEIIGIKE